MFLLAWLIPAWIVFEAVTTKLPHYTLPLYPAVALLSARAMSEASGRARGLGLGGVVWLVIGAVIASGVAAGLARVFGFAAPPGWMTAMGAGVGVGAGLIVASARALYTRAFVLAQTLGILAAVVASAVLFGVVLPRLSALWVSSRLMTVIDRADPARAARVASAGYGEDSLEYLLDGRMERVRVSEAGEWSSRHAGALIVLPTDRAQEALGSDVKILGRAAGFNYSKGEWVDLVVARAFQPVP
jgi:4-amino-4-deoxy-L-arabinose transferase-like glycosyltransferase